MSSGLIFQKTIAINTGIAESRLSKLTLNHKTIPLAKEIYLSALAINKKPSDAFKFIYNDLKLNSLKEQDRLRKEYETKKK
ncbi:MAG: XRE family transcriptional regulator [Bacteroidota bacterium]|nr:XRE family transcriptional regulator [Bacteroidota bacterium]